MPTATLLVDDDSYEELGAAYQCVQIALLDEALRARGIDDAKLREVICGDFVFNLGVFHDQNWFKAGDRPMRALICFAELLAEGEGQPDVASLGTVHAPSESFSYHEYAFGNTSAYFEGDAATRVEIGPEDDEEAGDEDED